MSKYEWTSLAIWKDGQYLARNGPDSNRIVADELNRLADDLDEAVGALRGVREFIDRVPEIKHRGERLAWLDKIAAILAKHPEAQP